MVLEDYLRYNAEHYPQKTAIIKDDVATSYGELYQAVTDRCEMLVRDGGIKGKIRTLRAFNTLEYLVEYFAVHLAGGIVAPLENDLPEATFARITHELSACQVADNIADVLYTTGSTGKPKCVMISKETIIADAENLIEAQGFSHELAFVINGPLNHAGCWSKIFPTIIVGGTLCLLDNMKDIDLFYQSLELHFEKFAMFLVPANIRILLQLSAKRLAQYAHKLDFIETGAAPMPLTDMKAICELLPSTRLYNTYASTETGIVSTFNFNDGECIEGCLGRPMKHSEVFITESGTVACKGATLMSGYLNDEVLTASVMRDGTVYTTDGGMIDELGRLRLLGRQDDIINVGGFKVAPSEVESVALELPEIKDCICVAHNHPILGVTVKLLVVLNDGATLDKKAVAKYIKSKLEGYKVPRFIDAVETIQHTFNGKLNRTYYR